MHSKGKGIPKASSKGGGTPLNRTQDSRLRPTATANVIDLAPSPKATNPVSIKIEHENPVISVNSTSTHNAPNDDSTAAERLSRCLTAYNNLFRTYYNHAPSISDTDIGLALTQCEALLAVADTHGSLPVIRPYLGNTFSQHRHALFSAIATDPPRWLNIAIPLQSASIFSEAIIHLAGCHPSWPWPTLPTAVDPSALAVVATKALGLTLLRAKVDANILRNTIAQAGRAVTVADAYPTWLVVQLFRDWFLDRQSAARVAGTPHSAACYRLLRQAGDAYLPAAEQVDMLEAAAGDGPWEDVGLDLKLLKEFARGEVEVLCRNRAMLDVEEARVDYLTCVEVRVEDFPWLKAGAGDEES